jgi:putative ABC transport system permease protein
MVFDPFRTWLRQARRDAGIVLAYALAVAFLVATVSIANWHTGATRSQLDIPGTRFIVFVPVLYPAPQSGGSPFAEGVPTAMMHDRDLRTVAAVTGVVGVAPYLLLRQADAVPQGDLAFGGLDLGPEGLWESFCSPNRLVEGRFLDPGDTDAVLLEQAFAKVSRKGVGDSLEVFGREFSIVGLVDTGIRPAKADVYAPLGVVREIARQSGLAGDLNVLLVAVAEPAVQDSVMARVREAIPAATISSYKCYLPALEGMRNAVNLAWVVSVVVVLFATFHAARTQWSSSIERTREIGVLKAIGWSSGAVMLRFLVESLLQAVSGGLIGCGGAIVLILGLRLAGVFGEHTAIPFDALAIGLGTSLAAAVGAGLFPVWRAWRLVPADALRRI